MINYETILSSYDDKLTLMQWLKKVEAALKDASATGFHVNKRGNATITFSIDFANGETLESEPLVLQQGESVESGEIRNGHLFLTLTNGDELDCGALFNGEVPSLNVRSLEVSGGLILDQDANAAIGGDLVVRGLTEVENIKARGDVETESLTAAGDEISAKKPVVEVMTGYTANMPTEDPKLSFSNVYCGAVKNGNKLTLVAAVNLSIIDVTYGRYAYAAVFGVPAAVSNKIFPSFGNIVDTRNLNIVVDSDVTNQLNATGYVQKYGNTYYFRVFLPSNLEIGKTYFIRYEVTFLLSDNLAA